MRTPTWKLPRPPRGAQRHPKGTQRYPEGSQGTRGVFEAKCANTIALFNKSDANNHFPVDGSNLTITKSTNCAHK